jgi:integrase
MSIERTAQGKRRVRWRDSEGKSRARVFRTLQDARAFEAEIVSAKRKGTLPDYRLGNMLVSEHAASWIENMHTRPATLATYRSRLNAVILPQLGDRRLNQVRRADIQRVITSMRSTSSPASIRGVYAVLHLLFADAVESELIAVSPCRSISLPPKQARPVQPLNGLVVKSITDAMPEQYRVLVWIGIGTGMRLGEVLGLRVSDILWMRREIRVERQMTAAGKIAELKTAASRRTIPVDSMIIDQINLHLQRFGELPSPSRTVFAKHWRRAAAVGVRFHDLRHTYASALIRSGLSVKVVQERLGHSSAMITLDVYGHLWPDDADLGRGVIEGLFAASGAEAGAGAGTP